jgi:hypothetical protein
MATTGSFFEMFFDMFFTWLSPSGNKKAPVLLRAGLRVQMMRSLDLCAHASRGPRGLAGFGGAFGRGQHGAATYGAAGLPSMAPRAENPPQPG